MSVDRYPAPIRLNRGIRWVIWESDDESGDQVMSEGPRAVSFGSADELRTYGIEHELHLVEDESSLHDFDKVQTWLDHGGEPDPSELLTAWNFAGDLARVVGAEFSDRSEVRDALYDKLFWACNLPAVTPPGERFEPEWSDSEIEELHKLMGEALAVVADALGP